MHKLTAAALSAALLSTGVMAAEPFMEVSFFSQNDPFMQEYAKDLRAEAQQAGTKLTVNYAQEDLVKEYQQLQLAARRGASVLIVNPVDPASVHQLIELAFKSNNLPIVFINRKPDESALNSYGPSWYVGTDSTQAGFYQAEMLTQYCLDHPETDRNGDGEISYYLLQGEPGLADTVYRSLSLERGLRSSPIIFTQSGVSNADWNFDQAMQDLDAFVRRSGLDKIEAIAANNDAMALGALQFLKTQGYNTGDPQKYIPIVGVDATPAALAAIDKGELVGTVRNDAAAQARVAFKLASLAAAGLPISSKDVGCSSADGKIFYVPYIKVYFDDQNRRN